MPAHKSRRKGPAKIRTPRNPAAAKTSPPKQIRPKRPSTHPTREEILQNVITAQAWDIKGLTRQRDHAFDDLTTLQRTLAEREAELVVAQRALEALRKAYDSSDAERRLGEVGAELWRDRLVEFFGQICGSRQGWTYDLNDPAVLAEVGLLASSGVFDHAFYHAQLKTPVDPVAAIHHYLDRGEREGLSPNVLFDAQYYAEGCIRALGRDFISPFRTRLSHYVAVGAGQGIAPSLWVDPTGARRLAGRDADDRFEPLQFYQRIGRARNIAPNPRIDLEWYRDRRGEALGDADPITDYLAAGAALGLSLHPLFDPALYAETYPAVRQARQPAFLHYLAIGETEGHKPNPLFEPDWYRANTSGKGSPRKGGEFAHYLAHGAAKGARTHPLFDGAFYRASFSSEGDLDIPDPLSHYLQFGASVRFPHPLFDTEHVKRMAPAALRYHAVPLVSFLRSPDRLNASPHPLFDPAHYVRQAPEAARWPEGPFLHFMRFGASNGANPHPLFDTAFYLAQCGNDVKGGLALEHYVRSGGRTRSPHALFDIDFYLQTNPDLEKAEVNPLVHFELFGGRMSDLRQPHLLFDIRWYAKNYADDLPDDVNLLADFLVNWRERPRAHRLFDMDFYATRARLPADRNPLAHYAARGRNAKAAPHPLFDSAYYERKVKPPRTWRRTLLEHYVNGAAPEDFLPHPSLQTPKIARALKPDISGLTPLERWLAAEKPERENA
jgi:hypothetical protein